ncbi:MAG: hypothetical protein ACLQDY_27695 [Streptosporangiaceae bacterium]
MAIRNGVPGHDNGTAILRAQPGRVIDGHVDCGYTGQYEVICPACGDNPDLSYHQLPRDLQKLRGPSESLASRAGSVPSAQRARGRLVDAAPATEAVT